MAWTARAVAASSDTIRHAFLFNRVCNLKVPLVKVERARDRKARCLRSQYLDGYTEAVTLAHALTLMVGLIRAQAWLLHRT